MVRIRVQYNLDLNSSSRSLVSKKLKNIEEHVDNVEIQNHSSKNIVVNAAFVSLSTQDQLSVEKQVKTEQNDSGDAV